MKKMKRIIVLLMTIILGVGLVGCSECSVSNNNVIYSGKPKTSVSIAYKIKEEYGFNDPIQIEIFFGTTVKKANIDYSTTDRENKLNAYKAEISAINKEFIKTNNEEGAFFSNPYNNENRLIIKSFNDFYEENYGISEEGEYLNSILYELPKSIFINQSGEIIFCIKTFIQSNGAHIYYRIIDDKIIFSNQK